MEKTRIVLHYDDQGGWRFLIEEGGSVDVFVVDDRVPNDRVYQMTEVVQSAEIDAVLKDDPVGHQGDERHAACAARISALLNGEKSHLTVVQSPPAQPSS